MQIKKYIAITLVGLLPLLLLTSCKIDANSKSNAQNIEDISQTKENIQVYTPHVIKDEFASQGVTLLIDADVTLGDISTVVMPQLRFSETYMDKMVYDFILRKYPDASMTGSITDQINWSKECDDKLLTSFSVRQSGYLDYIDVENDLSCSLCEVEHLFESNYITDIIPTKMTLSAKEASEKVADFLSDYSCFSFKPWNVLAANNTDSGKSGYYYITLQAFYDGIPVNMKCDQNEGVINACAMFSATEIFQLYGTILLETTDISTIERLVPLENVLDELKNNFYLFSQGETVYIDNISFEYKAQEINDGLINLRPVWCFSCTDIRTKLEPWETVNAMEEKYEILFFADDCTFCGLYY